MKTTYKVTPQGMEGGSTRTSSLPAMHAIVKRTIALIARAFVTRTPVVSAARVQWAAVKATVLASDDQQDMTALAHAETAARDHITRTYGRAAMFYPTDAQLDEFCAIALELMPRRPI